MDWISSGLATTFLLSDDCGPIPLGLQLLLSIDSFLLWSGDFKMFVLLLPIMS